MQIYSQEVGKGPWWGLPADIEQYQILPSSYPIREMKPLVKPVLSERRVVVQALPHQFPATALQLRDLGLVTMARVPLGQGRRLGAQHRHPAQVKDQAQ